MKRRHVPLLLLVAVVALFAAPAAGQEPLPLPQCSDLLDNDGDGQTDFPNDSDCTGVDDDSEAPPPPPPPPPQCSDNLDNDGDKRIDEADPGCASPTDDSESPNPECSDGADNDGDGDVDLNDAGCDSAQDNDESNDPVLPSQPTLTFDTDQFSRAVSGTGGWTVYANTGQRGQFIVDANASNADTVKFRSPSGATATRSAPFANPYPTQSVEAGEHTVTAYNAATPPRPGPSTSFTVVSDTAGPDPVAGFVNYPDGNVAVPGGGPVSIAVSWAPGQDIDSGLQPGSGILERQAVALVGTTCDFTVATWVEVTRSGVAGSLNESIAVGKCARYRYRISDNVGNETVYAALFVARNDPGDITPPRSVRRPRITTGDHRVVLTYRLPTVDFSRVKIYRWISGKKVETRGLLYKGTRSRKVDSGLFNRTRYVYQIVTCDRRDNCGLPGVILNGTPRSRYLISPRDGAILSRPPLLDWRAHPRASFYNLKLVRNGRTVLSRFPRRTEFKVRSTWKYKGVTRRYRDGTYFWYVWPRIGGRYGALMGWSRFTRP